MKNRIITGVLLGIVLIPITYFEIGWYIAMGLFCLVALYEMFKIHETNEKKIHWLVKLVTAIMTISFSMVAILGVAGFVGIDVGNEMIITYLLPTFVLSMLVFFVMTVLMKDFQSEDLGKIITIFAYVSVGTIALTTLRMLSLSLTIYAIIIAVATDVFAYLFGIRFGKKRLAPNISPKKSVEGAIAGTVAAVFLGMAFAISFELIAKQSVESHFVTILSAPVRSFNNTAKLSLFNVPLEIVVLFLISALLSVAGQFGDLFASKLKRNAGVKDFGKILPGHGGILDRVDSMIFISAVLVILILFFAKGF